MTGKPRSWRDIWHYIWKRVDSDNSITFNKLYNEGFVQQMLAEQFHNIGPDNTKHRFHEMFKEIKQQRGCAEDEEEISDVGEGSADDEGGEELSESLFDKHLRQKRQENNFKKITESIIRGIQ